MGWVSPARVTIRVAAGWSGGSRCACGRWRRWEHGRGKAGANDEGRDGSKQQQQQQQAVKLTFFFSQQGGLATSTELRYCNFFTQSCCPPLQALRPCPPVAECRPSAAPSTPCAQNNDAVVNAHDAAEAIIPFVWKATFQLPAQNKHDCVIALAPVETWSACRRWHAALALMKFVSSSMWAIHRFPSRQEPFAFTRRH
jgi:hypothetical protein